MSKECPISGFGIVLTPVDWILSYWDAVAVPDRLPVMIALLTRLDLEALTALREAVDDRIEDREDDGDQWVDRRPS